MFEIGRSIDLVDIVRAQTQVGLGERLPVAAELDHVAAVGLEVRIAAGDCVDEHGLPGREVEDARIGRIENRIAKLVDGRRAFLAGPAGDEIDPVDRREVRARADRRQRAEVRQLIDLGIGIEREVAERAEAAVRGARSAGRG